MSELDDLEYARAMGRSCAIDGPNETNCNFRLFARVELTRAWEQGKKDAEAKSAVGVRHDG